MFLVREEMERREFKVEERVREGWKAWDGMGMMQKVNLACIMGRATEYRLPLHRPNQFTQLRL